MSDSAIPWTVACHAPLSVEFSRQEYWGGLPFPSPGDLPNQWFEPTSPALAGGFFTSEPPGKPMISFTMAQEYQVGWHTLDCTFDLLSLMATRSIKSDIFGKKNFFFLKYLTVFWGCRILVPWPGSETLPSAVKTQSPNHLAAREFPKLAFLAFLFKVRRQNLQ